MFVAHDLFTREPASPGNSPTKSAARNLLLATFRYGRQAACPAPDYRRAGNSRIRRRKALACQLQQSVCIEDLADLVCMSPATLHRQFKLLTYLSPHQYLKRLRLLEARRLLFGGNTNVKSVAFQVGYLSASHFSGSTHACTASPQDRKGRRAFAIVPTGINDTVR